MNFKVFVWTPGHVRKPHHVEMLRVQSLVGRRLRQALPDVEITHALICDHVEPGFAEPVAEIAAAFDLFQKGIPESYGSQWGVVKPTRYAIDLARDAGCTHILRIIQDTYILDDQAFSESIRDVLPREGEWLGANLHQWTSNGHRWLCDLMKLPFASQLNYPNGAVMIGPIETWRKYYLGLPKAVHHFWDDVMMGEWMRHEGQPLHDIPTTWVHLHDAAPERSRAIYAEHLEKLDGAVALAGTTSVSTTGGE